MGSLRQCTEVVLNKMPSNKLAGLHLSGFIKIGVAFISAQAASYSNSRPAGCISPRCIAMAWLFHKCTKRGQNPWECEWGSPESFAGRVSSYKRGSSYKRKPKAKWDPQIIPPSERFPRRLFETNGPVWSIVIIDAAEALWSTQRAVTKERPHPSRLIDHAVSYTHLTLPTKRIV